MMILPSMDLVNIYIYIYNANFIKQDKYLYIQVQTNNTSRNCLEIQFDDIIAYKNDKQSLSTNLYTPKRIIYSLYSKDDVGIIEFD